MCRAGDGSGGVRELLPGGPRQVLHAEEGPETPHRVPRGGAASGAALAQQALKFQTIFYGNQYLTAFYI